MHIIEIYAKVLSEHNVKKVGILIYHSCTHALMVTIMNPYGYNISMEIGYLNTVTQQ